MAQILWAWRHEKKVQKLYGRLIPLLLLTLILISASGVAGTLSSKVATAMGQEVLISSPNCGILELHDQDEHEHSRSSLPIKTLGFILASNYALKFYAKKLKDENCLKYIQLRLPTTIMRDASCPFQEGMCKSRQRNIVLDTGYLDSHHHLGLNTPVDDRVLFRRVTSCAPLKTEGYKKSAKVSGFNFSSYFFGRTYRDASQTSLLSATYSYPEVSKEDQELESRLFDMTDGTVE